MIAKVSFLKNSEEIRKAKDMNLKPPEEEYEYDEFLFAMRDVSCAYRANTGQIMVYIDGWKWILEYNDEIWSRLRGYLNSQ